MKTLVMLFTAVATVSAFSQGQIAFNNFVPSANINAPIGYGAYGPVGGAALINPLGAAVPFSVNGTYYNFGGANARAALYYGHVGDSESTLQMLGNSVAFRTGLLLGLVDVSGGSARTLPSGFPVGSSAIFQIRAWDTGLPGTSTTTYEDAVSMIRGSCVGYFGTSQIVTINSLTVSPGALVGLQSFDIEYSVCPEPCTFTLGALGAVAGIFAFRRRKKF